MDWRSLFHRSARERELDEEFAFHLEARRRENMERGMAPQEAALAARRAMDGMDRHKESCRDARGAAEWVDRGLRLTRHGARRLAASPGFALVAVATLALGIGATTAVFSLINGILLEPLPYREPGQLVALRQTVTFGKRYEGLPVSAGHVREWRKSAKSLDGVSLINGDRRFLVNDGGTPVPVYQTNVSADFFRLVGVEPALGRSFAAGEDEIGKDNVAILSHEFWRDRFHSDPGVLGRRMRLTGGEAPVVIGVMPKGFSFLSGNDLNLNHPLPRRADYWRPLALETSQFNPVAEFNHMAIGRVRSGVAVATAMQELTRLSQGLVKASGQNLDVSVNGARLPDSIWGGVRQPLLLLSAAVGAVLLICCLNVANLMLSRLLARRHEYAVRASLGAGRGSLIMEMVAEGALLALGGGLLGLLAAMALMKALPGWSSITLPSSARLELDWRVGVFALALCAVAAALASVIPALRFSFVDPQEAMRQSGSSRTVAGGRAAYRLRSLLVGAEVALCVVLLVSAGLLIRSFDHLMRVEAGFEAARVLTLDAQLPVDRYSKAEQRLLVWMRLYEQIAALPGVTAVGAINRLPMDSERNVNGVLAEGETAKAVFEQPMANYRAATPGYFAAAGIALRKGRVYSNDAADRSSAVVSENLARRVWGEQDPLGRRFRRNGEGEWFTVVGVAADVRQASLEAAAPMMVYRGERGTGGLSVVVRSALAPAVLRRAVLDAMRKVDGGIMVDGVKTMEERVSATTAKRRWQTLVLGLFAGVATLLAGLGIWGVVSYGAGQRRNEIGLRIALGATAASVVGLVVRQGLRPIAVGAVAGIGLAVAASRWLESLLFGVQPLDAVSYLGAAAMLTLVAAAACAAPARRAAAVDPARSLRAE